MDWFRSDCDMLLAKIALRAPEFAELLEFSDTPHLSFFLGLFPFALPTVTE